MNDTSLASPICLGSVVQAMTAVAGFVFGMRHVLDDKTVKLHTTKHGKLYGIYGSVIRTPFVLTPSGSQ